jgi:sterol desaturase/sphingolipid hydroxylase (fatty acid hydroxylase superfamily)
MMETVWAGEPIIRLGCFLAVVVAMAVWEVGKPRRQLALSRWARWPGNLGIVALNTLVLRVLLPAAAVGFAVLVEERGWGIVNQLVIPTGLAIGLSLLCLDLAIYLQHVLFHAVPALWRLHRMHHADQDFDFTTGIRFHPLEVVLSAGIKLAVVVALGPPAVAVLAFEVMLNASSMFNHGNVGIPGRVDRVLRWFIVTPDMHRVHHSIIPRETNSNFGFNLPWWDRLFGTYRAQPESGHEGMTIGFEQFRTPVEQRLDRMLTQPFRGEAGAYPVRRG